MLEAAHTIVVITSSKRRTTTRSRSRPRAPTRPHQAGHVLQRKLTVSRCVASFPPPLLPGVVVSKDHHNNFDRIWKKEIRGRGRKKSGSEREEQKWWEECFIHLFDAKKDHGLRTYSVGTQPAQHTIHVTAQGPQLNTHYQPNMT